MDGEQIVAEIRTDGAHEAAAVVESTVIATAGVVAAEVAEVRTELEEHAEASEERHTEILQEEVWQQAQLANLSTGLQSVAATQAAIQAQITAEFSAIRAEMATLKPLTDSSQQTPPPESVAVAEVVVEEDPQEAEIREPEPQPKRRRRVI